jgi:cytochrome c553
MCQGCHGIPGWRTAFPEVYQVPKIAGQHPAYLVKALQDYKSGARVHPSMRAIAASLSDDDMNNIAAYYAQSGLAVAP